MVRVLRAGAWLLLIIGVWPFLLHYVQAQEPEQNVQAEWLKQLSEEIANPPERGGVRLDEFKAATNPNLPVVSFNRYLSLLVTDVDTVDSIKFSDVMDQLAKQSGDPLFGKEMLFHQWWDTQDQHPGLLLGPHCDDIPPQDKAGHFKYDCPRFEGSGTPAPSNTPAQATDENIFAHESVAPGTDNYLDAYSAIAFSNRYDLRSPAIAATGGKIVYPDCGEYRIIFARNSGKTLAPSQSPDGKLHEGDLHNRNLISFEFRVKNPNPVPESATAPGPQGCLPILKFWYSLSETDTGQQRGQLLKAFFMEGQLKAPDGQSFGQIPKVVDISNLNFQSGQIRTDQFINNVLVKPPTPPHDYTPGTPGSTNVDPNNWVLREFRTLLVGHRLLIVPDTTKSNPDVSLFASLPSGSTADPRLVTLITNIKTQAKNLLGGGQFDHQNDINAIAYTLSRSVTNGNQSVSGSPVPCSGPSKCDPTGVDNVVSAFAGNVNLSTDIQDELVAIGAPQDISSLNIIDRLRTQTCAGCHQFSDTKLGGVGYDDPNGLGGGAKWPTKACGDYAPSCSLPSFLITDASKLHPPMQFTQVSETVLLPSAADTDGKHWRYAISSTAECMLDFREKVLAQVLNLPPPTTNHCPQ